MISDYYYPLDFTENCNCFTKLNVVLFFHDNNYWPEISLKIRYYLKVKKLQSFLLVHHIINNLQPSTAKHGTFFRKKIFQHAFIIFLYLIGLEKHVFSSFKYILLVITAYIISAYCYNSVDVIVVKYPHVTIWRNFIDQLKYFFIF